MTDSFIMEKATNMKKLFEPFILKEEHKTLLNQYNTIEQIKDVVQTQLKPLYLTNTLTVASDFFCNELNIADPNLRNKAYRYLQCFCELIIGV